jgi:hypothetical protein
VIEEGYRDCIFGFGGISQITEYNQALYLQALIDSRDDSQYLVNSGTLNNCGTRFEDEDYDWYLYS